MRMITLEIIYALLQGLPVKYLDFLEPPWPPFCLRIEHALKDGVEPMEALKYALDSLNEWGRGQLRKALSNVRPVLELPSLSYRQKEALIAMRSAGVASLAQLGRVLMQDRSNLLKRITVLVNKGYAMKFFRQGGVYYYALPHRLEKSLKISVFELLDILIAETASQEQPGLTT